MISTRSLVPVAAALALAAAGATRAMAQDAPAVDRAMASRADLEAIANDQGDANLAGRARARLTDGDFRPGDRIWIVVQGDTALSDTFPVWPDGALHLPSPTVGTLSLQGVLRSEVQQKLQTYIARFVRNPVVRARPLIRLSFQGDFAHAGFYSVPADAPLVDAMMAAGGTTTTANMSKAKVERRGRDVLNPRGLQDAIAAGRTVDELGLRDGDQFVVPKANPSNVMGTVRSAAVVVSLGVGLLTLSKRM